MPPPYRQDAGDPVPAAPLPAPARAPYEVTLSGIGAARVTRVVRRGPLFDVFEAQGKEKFCVKAPSLRPWTEQIFQSSATGEGTSLWGGTTGRCDRLDDDRQGVVWSLLLAEAEAIRRSGSGWNHKVCGMVSWDRPYAERLVGGYVPPESGRMQPALVMPWHDGSTLDRLDPAEQRALLPRMMPSLWRALAAAPHGDLWASNLLLSPGRDRFVLLDPGVSVWSFCTYRRGDAGMDNRVFFTTRAEGYPLLPPMYRWCKEVGPGSSLPAHLDAVERHSPLVGPVVGLLMHRDDDRPGLPSPPDLQAVGILYYLALTGVHPFFDASFREPAWVGGFGEVRCSPACNDARARLARGLTPPGDLRPGISKAENELALALLELTVRTVDELATLAARAR